jgi:hypothetical protein
MNERDEFEVYWFNHEPAAPIETHSMAHARKAWGENIDAKRWKHFASNQTALMLGSDLDPNDETIDWLQECNRLADNLIMQRLDDHEH